MGGVQGQFIRQTMLIQVSHLVDRTSEACAHHFCGTPMRQMMFLECLSVLYAVHRPTWAYPLLFTSPFREANNGTYPRNGLNYPVRISRMKWYRRENITRAVGANDTIYHLCTPNVYSKPAISAMRKAAWQQFSVLLRATKSYSQTKRVDDRNEKFRLVPPSRRKFIVNTANGIRLKDVAYIKLDVMQSL